MSFNPLLKGLLLLALIFCVTSEAEARRCRRARRYCRQVSCCAQPYGDCQRDKDGLNARFDEVKFGSCNHPTAYDADSYANSVLIGQLLADGYVLKEAGHTTVNNNGLPNTYLSYAAGDR